MRVVCAHERPREAPTSTSTSSANVGAGVGPNDVASVVGIGVALVDCVGLSVGATLVGDVEGDGVCSDGQTERNPSARQSSLIVRPAPHSSSSTLQNSVTSTSHPTPAIPC